MRHHKKMMVTGLFVAGLALSGCGGAPETLAIEVEPARVEAIEGTELNRVVLVPEAAKRLDIRTAAVRDTVVVRKRIVGGEVVAAPAGAPAGSVVVRVPMSTGDLDKVDRAEAVTILPLAGMAGSAGSAGTSARPVEMPAATSDKATPVLHYAPDGASHGLAAGQRVRVELSLAGSKTPRRVVPYSAVIYDLKGDTWVYTSATPLTFVREKVAVDFIEGDLAVLSQGPAAGTQIATAGAAELYGTEFGVGH